MYAIFGQVSVGALIFCSNFSYNYATYNEYTGQRVADKYHDSNIPVWKMFSEVLQNIQRSRRDFEQRPDKGIFSKKCCRLCNLFYNYIFKFWVIGVFLVLGCMPVLCIASSAVLLLLALTAYIYMPFVLLLTWLFQILLYDFDNPGEEFYVGLSKYLPLFHAIAMFTVKGVFQLALSVALLMLQIMTALFFLVWGPARLIIRTIYDLFMYLIIKSCGRVPSIDTCFAKMIKGPKIGHQFYQFMDEKSLEILFRYNLEAEALDQYQKRMLEIIKEPSQKADKAKQSLAECQGFSFEPKYNLKSGHIMLEEKLSRILVDRKNSIKTYCSYIQKFRFNQKQLATFLPQTKAIIQELFAKYDLDHLWSRHQVEMGNFTEMNECLWKKYFRNENVLEPLEELEEHITVQNQNQEINELLTILHINPRGEANQKQKFKLTNMISVEQLPNKHQFYQFADADKLVTPLVHSLKPIDTVDIYFRQPSLIYRFFVNYHCWNSQPNNDDQQSLLVDVRK